ncbi:EVE domain-containing protein [Priestia aryabhattai]|uniref:EVE domain-containing protein n=1 Tax=Priestia aryabhattai TaxID=412384 RepID=UPI003D7F79F9
MPFLHIINNFEIGYDKVEAEEIMDILFKKKVWLYNANTPNFSKINVDDKVIVYIAGAGRRYFTATFTIKSKMMKHEFQPENQTETVLLNMFKYYCEITDIVIFKEPVNILKLKEELEFIKDKKNYGLFFRQSVKSINQRDYEKILQSVNMVQAI